MMKFRCEKSYDINYNVFSFLINTSEWLPRKEIKGSRVVLQFEKLLSLLFILEKQKFYAASINSALICHGSKTE